MRIRDIHPELFFNDLPGRLYIYAKEAILNKDFGVGGELITKGKPSSKFEMVYEVSIIPFYILVFLSYLLTTDKFKKFFIDPLQKGVDKYIGSLVRSMIETTWAFYSVAVESLDPEEKKKRIKTLITYLIHPANNSLGLEAAIEMIHFIKDKYTTNIEESKTYKEIFKSVSAAMNELSENKNLSKKLPIACNYGIGIYVFPDYLKEALFTFNIDVNKNQEIIKAIKHSVFLSVNKNDNVFSYMSRAVSTFISLSNTALDPLQTMERIKKSAHYSLTKVEHIDASYSKYDEEMKKELITALQEFIKS